MTRRFVTGLAALALVAACTNSKAGPPPTTRVPLRPLGTSTTVTATSDGGSTSRDPTDASTTFRAAPFGTGCADLTVPFQVTGEFSGWNTDGALWSGPDPVSGAPGIIEVHQGDDLPEPIDPAPITVLGGPATIGAISDGFVVRFRTGGPPSFSCGAWALVAHPQTTIDTLRALAERLTLFGVGEVTLDCNAALADDSPMDPSDETLMNLVDLPVRRALQTSRQDGVASTGTHTDSGSVLFAKSGLIVHPGVAFDLAVDRASRGVVAMGWSRDAAPVSVVHVPACAPRTPPAARLAFIGGFYAPQPVCATILVVDFDVITPVHIGVGTPCDGQAPIEGPTDT